MTSNNSIQQLAVIGAGTMGSGIAQKIATEGFSVFLVDLSEENVQRGIERIRSTLEAGVKRGIFKPEQVEQIMSRIKGTSRWSDLADVDLVVEAVFEDQNVKKEVFRQLEQACRADTVIGTNTSSFAVTDLAAEAKHPERIIGLHYFYHPAMNRLVEVVPGAKSDQDVIDRAWAFQEQIGKIPIASADAYGFVVNRYFVPWLNESVRLLEEGVADIATIDTAAKETFGIGMGPFELMNVTGVPIALHSCQTLGAAFGQFYAPAELLAKQVESKSQWDLSGEPDRSKFQAVSDRLLGGIFYVAAQLVEEGVSSITDTDIGARVGLRWPIGPFEMANKLGVAKALELASAITDCWSLPMPKLFTKQAASGAPFAIELVHTSIRDGVATLMLNRPDAMNALNEKVVQQLTSAFDNVVKNPAVKGIVIAGSGKAFIAGADIRFFVENIENKDIDRIFKFTKAGQDLLAAIDRCAKPVVARMHGLALGGGMELALACDYIVASEKAVMSFPETGIGIYPGLGGTQRTTRRVGVGLAKYLVLTGQMLNARQAADIGLIDAAVSAQDLDETVSRYLAKGPVSERKPATVPGLYRATAEFFAKTPVEALLKGDVSGAADGAIEKAAAKVAKKAPVAVRLAAQLIEEGAELPLEQALQLELDHLHEIFSTEDAYTGLSTLGKGAPDYKGR